MIIKLLAAAALTAAVLTPTTSVSSLDWGDCPGGDGKIGMQCAPLTVPLDWSNPNGRKVTLMLGRLKADDPDAGTVLVNFGGPGAAGISFMRDYETTIDPFPFEKLRHKMNVVTWDPRGYPGLSKPSLDSSCVTRLPDTTRRMPALPRNQAEFGKQQATSRALADACRPQDPGLFDNMHTAANVRDMDAIRDALHIDNIDLYMGSYGGVYGQSYAREYPMRVRRMVLDSTGDHTTDYASTQQRIAGDNLVRWNRFADWCAADTACALHGRNVSATWRSLIARANRHALPVSPTAAFDGSTLQEVATGVMIRGGGPAEWAPFAKAIKDGTAGDGSGFAADPAHPYPISSYPVSECHEWPRLDYRQYATLSARLDRIDPNLGAAGTMIPFALSCVGWPGSVVNPPRPLPAGLPPVLGVGAWGDFPATNRIIRQLPGSRMIYHDGYGHELYATGNACVIDHVDTYFITGSLPPATTTC
ncbi:alpha/beta hydrolase [Fodinicola acaciae]|uniref:alpha/beta hydrolase n=1 Tax=Fodinicola acaciae TaxID=2681555 RepID=UPI0013CF54FF|nr:alpha/beta hydrolase [Fodinicola acaciae]